MQNNLTTTCNAILVSPQFADEDDDDDGTVEPGNAACAWIQSNGVYTHTAWSKL